MKKEPNPKQLTSQQASLLTIDNVETFKKIYCRQYDYCLTKAANRRWANFHCTLCRAYDPIPEDERKKIHQRNSVDTYEIIKP